MFSQSIEHLYVHIPFCHRICPYCGFFKHTPGNTDMEAFVDALLGELRTRSGEYAIRPVTLFFGGGTPTMLSPTHMQRLLEGMRSILDLSQLAEWTIEANPRTFDLEKLGLLREMGVTRISLGVQSWQPRLLGLLGRDHAPGQAEESFRLIREAGIPTASLDLMFSLPGQTLGEWQADLDRTIAMAPDHISTYNLNYEEDTEFFRRLQDGEYKEDADADADFFECGWQKLDEAGFAQYEISNFARPGAESRHNQAYWHGRDFLGIGPGAVSTIRRRRWTGIADTAKYIECIGRFGRAETNIEELTHDQWLVERVAIELRTREGTSVGQFSEQVRKNILPNLVSEDMAAVDGNQLRLTVKGRMLVDEIATCLLDA